MESLESFEKVLGYSFRKPELLREALTHKSYLNEIRVREKEKSLQDNERLEFLGDAVLDLVISERLIILYPLSAEGDLSKMKARIVSEVALARVSKRIGVGQFLLLGKGEERTRGREKPSLLADALEAVIAAIHLDGGFESSRRVLSDIFKDEMLGLDQHQADRDFKTKFQEYCQRRFDSLPSYRVLHESGPDHQKLFEVKLVIKNRIFGTGRGKSKKEAEQQAARQALEKIENDLPIRRGKK